LENADINQKANQNYPSGHGISQLKLGRDYDHHAQIFFRSATNSGSTAAPQTAPQWP